MQVELPRHRLPWSFFIQLCTGPASAAAIENLRSAQLSRRKLQVRALTELLDTRPDSPAHAWSVLVAADRRDPGLVNELLLHPSAGVWLTRTLRKLSGAATDSTPLRTDLDYLASIAGAAATRCGIPCTLEVPVVHGVITLPTVGQITLPSAFPAGRAVLEVSPDGTAAVRTLTSSASVAFSAPEPSPGFVPVTRHTATSHRLRLSIEVDDRGPYRTFAAPIGPRPLDPLEYAEWAKLLDEAWDILTTHYRGFAEELSAGMSTLVPLESENSITGASSSIAFGAIAMTAKYSAVDLAEALVHELQHSKLNALFDLVELHEPDCDELFYAPWRDDPRPIGGLLHGALAFVTAVEFWRVQAEHEQDDELYAQFNYAYRRRQVRQTAETLLASPALTGFGRRFVASIAERLSAVEDSAVTDEVREVVAKVADEHQAAWRLQHLRPDENQVLALAKAWSAGAQEPPGPLEPAVVVPCYRSLTRSPRSDLLKLRFLGQENAVPSARTRNLSTADLHYVAGDRNQARAAYTATIRASPQDDQAWLGLGLTSPAEAGGTRSVLLTSPHVVLAVRDKLLARNHQLDRPVELVRWLNTASVPAD